MHPNLSFWGENDFFWRGVQPGSAHPTPSTSIAPRPLLTGLLNTLLLATRKY